jgi:hypothetical protein
MRENRTARSGRSGVAAMAPDGPIDRPLPAGEFDVHGLNAEMRWEVMRGNGYVVPNASFFVRNHTATPLIEAETWSLSVFGTGLRGSVTAGNAVAGEVSCQAASMAIGFRRRRRRGRASVAEEAQQRRQALHAAEPCPASGRLSRRNAAAAISVRPDASSPCRSSYRLASAIKCRWNVWDHGANPCAAITTRNPSA